MPPRRAKKSKETIVAEVGGDNAADIVAVYDAPFPIYSEEEEERYNELRIKSIKVPKYFNFDVLDQIGLTDKLKRLCRRGEWEQFVRISYPVYRDLALEVFTSLRFVSSKPKKLWFRLRGQVWFLDENLLRFLFGFVEKEVDDGHQSFTIRMYWKYLIDLDEYDPHIASNVQILSAEQLLLHKFMCGAVFGKRKSTKCSGKELFLLWCIDHSHKPNMFAYVSQTLIQSVGRKGNSLGMGYSATALAENFRIDVSDLIMLDFRYFDVQYLKRVEIIYDNRMQLRDPSTRTALKHRLAAAASSDNAIECFSENEGPQQQAQAQAQVGQPDLGIVYTLLVENNRKIQQQLDEIKQQVHEIKQQLNDLTERTDVLSEDLQYMGEKLHKSWEIQGLDVLSPTPSPSGTPPGPSQAS